MKNVLTKISYMAVGSLLTLIGYHFGNIDNNSADAQLRETPQETEIVDEIKCRKLVIVGKDDTARITLDTHFLLDSGEIQINNRHGVRRISLRVATDFGTDGVLKDLDPGVIEIFGNEPNDVGVVLGMDDYGGFMALFNNVFDKAVLQASITDRGEGLLFTRDEVGNHIDTVGQLGRNKFFEKFRKSSPGIHRVIQSKDEKNE